MRCRVCGGRDDDNATTPLNETGYHEACFMERFSRTHGAEEAHRMWVNLCGMYKEQEQEDAKQKRWQKEEAEEEFRRQARETWNQFFGGYQYFNFGGFNNRWQHGKRAHARPETKGDTVELHVDKQRMRDLLRLCHPDKHSNSDLSTKTTKWLTEHYEQFQ